MFKRRKGDAGRDAGAESRAETETGGSYRRSGMTAEGPADAPRGVFAEFGKDGRTRSRVAPALDMDSDSEAVARMLALSGDRSAYKLGKQTGFNPEIATATGRAEPVVGWLVIIAGPGKGRDLRLTFGVNDIGSGPGLRMSMNFGDDSISQDTVFTITFDPKSNRCYVHHRQGRTLVYLNDSAVLAPAEISDGDRIQVGETVMTYFAFVPGHHVWSGDEE